MGIYIFNSKTMEEVLDNKKTDFGKEIIPQEISVAPPPTSLTASGRYRNGQGVL